MAALVLFEKITLLKIFSMDFIFVIMEDNYPKLSYPNHNHNHSYLYHMMR